MQTYNKLFSSAFEQIYNNNKTMQTYNKLPSSAFEQIYNHKKTMQTYNKLPSSAFEPLPSAAPCYDSPGFQGEQELPKLLLGQLAQGVGAATYMRHPEMPGEMRDRGGTVHRRGGLVVYYEAGGEEGRRGERREARGKRSEQAGGEEGRGGERRETGSEEAGSGWRRVGRGAKGRGAGQDRGKSGSHAGN
jgi:hypothetical protein